MKEQILPVQEIQMQKSELNYWKSEIKSSLKRQKKEFIDEIQYKDLINYYEAKQAPAGQSWCIMDEWSPAITSVVTSVYTQNPTVQVEATNPQGDQDFQPSLLYLLQNPDFKPFSQKELIQGAVKHLMDKTKMKGEMQICAFDLMVAGFSCAEVNHTTSSDVAPSEDKDPYEKTGPDNPILDKITSGIQSLVEKVMPSKSMSDEDAEEKVVKETQKDLHTDQTNQTYVKWLNPMDVLFDPRAKVFNESRWVGKIVRMSVAEFKARYPRFKDKNVGDSEIQNIQYAQHLQEENKKSVTLYEIEIRKKEPRNCVAVFNLSLDEPVDYYEKPIITNDFSIKYSPLDKYGKIYPMSRGKKAKRPQDDINHYMTLQFEHVDRAQRKIAVFAEGLTESGKAAQRSSDVYAVVEKKIPGSVYETMPAPQVVPENKEIVQAMRESINKAIGSNELVKSGQSSNDTLGQDEIQVQSFQVNVNAVQDALQDLSDQVLDTFKDIVLQIWDDADYFKVEGIKGGTGWYDPQMGAIPDIVIGDYSVKCNIASAARPNPAKDRKDYMELNAVVTSPQMVQFAMLNGKRPTMETLNNLIKTFNINPDMVYEDIGNTGPIPPNPEAKLVESEGSRLSSVPNQNEGAMQGAPV